jgi:hypothetical protein
MTTSKWNRPSRRSTHYTTLYVAKLKGRAKAKGKVQARAKGKVQARAKGKVQARAKERDDCGTTETSWGVSGWSRRQGPASTVSV